MSIVLFLVLNVAVVVVVVGVVVVVVVVVVFVVVVVVFVVRNPGYMMASILTRWTKKTV